MANYSNDAIGYLTFYDEKQTKLFDRLASVSVAGWSNHPSIKSRATNVDESTGRHTVVR